MTYNFNQPDELATPAVSYNGYEKGYYPVKVFPDGTTLYCDRRNHLGFTPSFAEAYAVACRSLGITPPKHTYGGPFGHAKTAAKPAPKAKGGGVVVLELSDLTYTEQRKLDEAYRDYKHGRLSADRFVRIALAL